MNDCRLQNDRSALVQLLAALTAIQRIADNYEKADRCFRTHLNLACDRVADAIAVVNRERRNLSPEEVVALEALTSEKTAADKEMDLFADSRDDDWGAVESSADDLELREP